MNVEIRITGPVYLYENGRNDQMSALTDAVNALVAEDGAVVSALNDLKAKADAGGQVSAADVQTAVDTVNGEVAKLSAAVSADDPAPADQPAAPADNAPASDPNTPADQPADGSAATPDQPVQ